MSGYAFEALRFLEAAVIAFRPSLPAELASARMLREIGAAQSALVRPPGDILEEVRMRLRNGGESPRDLCDAPWILWHGNPQAIGFPGLLDRVVKQAAQHRRTLRNLIEAWVRDFTPDRRGIREAGLAIVALLQNDTDARLNIWRNAHTRLSMFDPTMGPHAITAEVLNGQRPVVEVLESLGFADELRATSGYMRAIYAECLAELPRLLRSTHIPTRFSRVTIVLIDAKQLRFPDARLNVARLSLRAWLDGGQPPSPEAQSLVKNFVLKYIGHPQLQPRLWVGADAEAAIVRRWLAQASLSVFFGLIADHARDKEWQYREAFWSACLRKGAIADAWLALGKRVHASARARKELGSAFGLLSGSLADQSVLLMQLGPIVVAEWSHDGRLRAWPAQKGPKLYESTYTREDLIKSGLPFPPDATDFSGLVHSGAPRGHWQRRAAALLAQHVGLILSEADWQVR